MKYYLINNKIMKGSEMPETKNWNAYSSWLSSLQPCEISESELEYIYKRLLDKYGIDSDELLNPNPIDVTNLISDNNGVITFKHPKQVDGEIEAVDNDLIWTDVCVSIVNRENKQVPFTETLKYLKSKYTIKRNI